MKITLIKKIFLFGLFMIVCNCKNSDSKKPKKETISISMSDTYILIDDKSFLLENFTVGYTKAHNKKLKKIYPDTIYKVSIEVSNETKINKIMMIKNVLKKHNVKKANIEIRDANH